MTDVETADRVLPALSETVGNRLREDNVQMEVVSVGIKYADQSYVSHQKVLQTENGIKEGSCVEFKVKIWHIIDRISTHLIVEIVYLTYTCISISNTVYKKEREERFYGNLVKIQTI